jgi:hypothetical protein
MIKINKEIEILLTSLDDNEVGFFGPLGAAIGDCEFIIYYNDNSHGPFLAHVSEFESDGILVKLK